MDTIINPFSIEQWLQNSREEAFQICIIAIFQNFPLCAAVSNVHWSSHNRDQSNEGLFVLVSHAVEYMLEACYAMFISEACFYYATLFMNAMPPVMVITHAYIINPLCILPITNAPDRAM